MNRRKFITSFGMIAAAAAVPATALAAASHVRADDVDRFIADITGGDVCGKTYRFKRPFCFHVRGRMHVENCVLAFDFAVEEKGTGAQFVLSRGHEHVMRGCEIVCTRPYPSDGALIEFRPA